jgi:hypothetical protein
MDDGIAHSASSVAGAIPPVAGPAQPFTHRQVMILRAMLAVMALTLIGGGGLVVTALVWKLRQAPAAQPVQSVASLRALAAAQPGVMFSDAAILAGAKLVSSHLSGDEIVLIYEDAGGTTLARFDHKNWKFTGLARLSAQLSAGSNP